jgi:hypothetical protein
LKGLHYATNKSQKFTPPMKDIAEKYGLDLDGDWNKEYLPHRGRHPYVYHDFVLDAMKNAHQEAQGDKERFLELFDQNVKQVVRDNPDLLYKRGWE